MLFSNILRIIVSDVINAQEAGEKPIYERKVFLGKLHIVLPCITQEF